MHRTFVSAACAMVMVLHFGPPTAAQSSPHQAAFVGDTIVLTLEEAQRRALIDNPAFLAERQESAIAQGSLRQARVYRFNPQLEFEAPGATTGAPVERYEASLTQEVEWAGQRGFRIRAARLGLGAAEAGVRNSVRITLATVSASFYEALAAQQRLEVTRELLVLSERLLRATQTQLGEGEISAMEANLAAIEVGRARARILTAERQLVDARSELRRITGIGEAGVVFVEDDLGASPGLPPLTLAADSLIGLALARRPDLAARSQALQEAQALTSLARREAIPNLEIGALAEREGANGEPRFGLGVSLPFPLWNRNQGLVQQRTARADQAEFERQAVELAIRSEVEAAVVAYETASLEASIFAEQVVEPARENQNLLEIAYREGKIGLSELLLLRNQLLDAELSYWDAWLAGRRARLQLDVATGSLGNDIDLSNLPENSNEH